MDDNGTQNTLVEIIAHPYEFTITPASEPGPDCYDIIHAWCLDRDSNPVLIKINDFPSYCWIELPETIRNNSFYWSQSDAREVFNVISNKAKEHAPLNFFLKYTQKAYYFKMCKLFPMILVQFSQEASMRRVVSMLVDTKLDNLNLFGQIVLER